MATSIASQLQAINSFFQIEAEPTKRPFTRPSVIYNPKEAADIDLDTLLSLALSGLEVLIKADNRFGVYKNSLFSHKSRDLDRELKGLDENKKIDESIASYLRLLSGHLQLPSALKTLEYLIRRYKVHVYNMDELLLCALPYHDTHAFVRIAQILQFRNSKWGFLEGVKVSGAPPPRKVIVQQCIRDMGLFEALCDYASSTTKYQPSSPVVSFVTAVVIEVLGAVPTIDDSIVRRVLPFVLKGLDTSIKGGPDHKAASLMVVSLLANRAALVPEVIKNLTLSIARVAQKDAKESADLPWLRTSLMTIITLVQSQSHQMLPKKALEILNEIRDFAEILFGLSMEFNIRTFLSVYFESLINYSASDKFCLRSLISTIETVDVKDFIDNIVARVLTSCTRLFKRMDNSKFCDSGYWAKQILVSIDKSYPSELRGAVRKFLEVSNVSSIKGDPIFEILCMMLDGSLDESPHITDSKIWFSLEHPKAEVRRSTLSNLAKSGILKAKAVDSQKLVTIREAMLRRLHDDDLGVVRAALSINGLTQIISAPNLFAAFRDILRRCEIASVSDASSEVCDVAISCLECAILSFKEQTEYEQEVARMMFPFLLVLPKTRKLHVRVLEFAKRSKWQFYQRALENTFEEKDLSEPSSVVSINVKTIGALAETFSERPKEYMPWLAECSSDMDLSKTLFFLLILQSITIREEDPVGYSTLFQVCFPVLKQEWRDFESAGHITLMEELNVENLDKDCGKMLEELLQSNVKTLNAKLLVSIFLRLLKGFVSTVKLSNSADNGEWLRELDNLFVFFAASQLKHLLREHFHLLLMNCNISAVSLLSKYLTEEGVPVAVQVESLLFIAATCGQLSSGNSIDSRHWQLLLSFPAVLVPLSSGNQDIRTAAMVAIEGLFTLWQHVDVSSGKNGNDVVLESNVWKLLGLIVQNKRLILSDRDYLPSYLMALLGPSCDSLVVPQNIQQRFNQQTRESIFRFLLSAALKLPAYGKLVILSMLKGTSNSFMHVEGIQLLLSELLDRRSLYHLGVNESGQALSKFDMETLCLLLEISAASNQPNARNTCSDYFMKALQVGSMPSEDPAIIQPCTTVLLNLKGSLYRSFSVQIQDQLFQELVFLFRNTNGAIQNAAREALLQINVTCSTVSRLIELILAEEDRPINSSSGKKKKKQTKHLHDDLQLDLFCTRGGMISFLSSLLDVLLMKKDIEKRASMIDPLFKLLKKIFSNDWLLGHGEKCIVASSGVSQSIGGTISYLQQAVLVVIEDITASLLSAGSLKDEIPINFDMKLLIKCARAAKDSMTRNHVFTLLSSIAKVNPEKVLDCIFEIFAVMGESAASQNDSQSESVFEDLISTVVPQWLSRTDNPHKLLQIFIDVLPEVTEGRRIKLIVFLLRVLGEKSSLASVLMLLMRSLVSRIRKSNTDEGLYTSLSTAHREWEYLFSAQLCEQYSCMIWLPSLIDFLQQIRIGQSQEQLAELLLAMQFIHTKLRDTELVFKLESGEDADSIQRSLGELLEQVVSHSELVNARGKVLNVDIGLTKELKECMHIVLKTITKKMTPSAYFSGTILLLGNPDGNVQKKALGLLCETVRDLDTVKPNRKGRRHLNQNSTSSWLHLDENAWESLREMSTRILQLVDGSMDDSDVPLKLAAVSALEILANKFGSHDSIFSACLKSVTKEIASQNSAVCSGCLRTTGALITVLGPRALPELPHIMNYMLKRTRDISSSPARKLKHNQGKSAVGSSGLKETVLLSVLVLLEAVVDKLGSFLSPYLEDIIELMVLHPDFVSGSDSKMKLKADLVRKLICERIPVRLTLAPLLKLYTKTVQSGESSLCIAFDTLSNLIGTMDKSSIGSYHAKIFEHCLIALDLRRESSVSVKKVNVVEENVIDTMIVLSMKLTEKMFKPLFIRSIEWAESEFQASGSSGSRSLDRSISFYRLVSKFAEQHRSLFVPYFKYMLDSCVSYLTDSQDAQSGALSQKKKKLKTAKVSSNGDEGVEAISHKQWHLRALIISSLHKCFIYDAGNLKFLDSSNFQILLKPIVAQLVAEPPTSLEEFPDVPSVAEVDDSLVACLGQMAVTAGSDLLWKPLNHEVLMQTRSEKVRGRILGLRVVKYLVEHLKEEYLIFLAETIPFLGELLEDVEIPVKSLAQEILKEMEMLSGESLKQYL